MNAQVAGLSYEEWAGATDGEWPIVNVLNGVPGTNMATKIGFLILPNGKVEAVEGLDGNYVTLQELTDKAVGHAYARQFRIDALNMLKACGGHADPVLTRIQQLTRDADPVIAETARLACGVIVAAPKPSSATPATSTGFPYGRHAPIPTTTRVEVNQVEFAEVGGGGVEAGERVFCKCQFCDKNMVLTPAMTAMSDRLAGRGRVYCVFCLRNSFHRGRAAKNVFMISLKGLFGYYYQAFNVIPKTSTMHCHDLWEMVDLHVRAGVQSPVFKYDHETFTWFIDFARVGRSGRRVTRDEVLGTIAQMVLSFDPYGALKEAVEVHKYWAKVAAGVDRFYRFRQRPPIGRVFVPTLVGCGLKEDGAALGKVVIADDCRTLIAAGMKDNVKKNYNNH